MTRESLIKPILEAKVSGINPRGRFRHQYIQQIIQET